MNSRQPALYLYEVDKAKEQQIHHLASGMGIKVHQVLPADYLQPIGVLLALPGFERMPMRYGGPLLSDEMMLMSDFDDTLLSRFLSAYRHASIPPIYLKAGVTPHNIFWTSLQLHQELQEEHQMMQR
ncbi:MAG: DUF3783 domain-containing protein [Bacteroides sp.]